MEELILKERKIREDIVNAINDANLPAFILKPIIKELYDEIIALDNEQYAEALKIKEAQEKEETKEEDKKDEEEE